MQEQKNRDEAEKTNLQISIVQIKKNVKGSAVNLIWFLVHRQPQILGSVEP